MLVLGFVRRWTLGNLASCVRTQRMAANRNSSDTVDSTGGDDKEFINAKLNPLVRRVRQHFSSDSIDGWERCWEEGLTPWDLGQATPIITNLVQTGKFPRGRALVPGCGSGYDVVAMATPERYVVGLDISSIAIKKANEWSSSLPNSSYFEFIAEDFFSWSPDALFDVIFDYTFFCAIHPTMRLAWAKKVSELLKPTGELITLMYLFVDQKGGPPYSTSVADYEEVLTSVGFRATLIMENELAVKPRKGAEKLGRWKKCNLSPL